MTISAALGKRLSPVFELEVELTAPAGITILFGASGSGKTTVLRCLAGLTRPDSGRIAIGDRVLFDAAAGVDVAVRDRHAGYVFQHLALFPHLTLDANIGYGLGRRSADERRRRVLEIADSFHIRHLLERKPGAVSGGERQRAALARALVVEPRMLLLDEPLSALDYAVQSQIMEDLRSWNGARRIPILYVTHSHREVYGLGERVIVLERGRTLATGSPHEVLDHPGHGALASLAGFENVFTATVTARRERAGTMQCRIAETASELEVPLGSAGAGDRVDVAIRAGDILVANQEPRGLSARNVLRGRLVELVAHGPTMIATVDAGARFVVHLTPGGVESLGLRPGSELWLIIKTYSCRLLAG